jgi:hypothetical protein
MDALSAISNLSWHVSLSIDSNSNIFYGSYNLEGKWVDEYPLIDFTIKTKDPFWENNNDYIYRILRKQNKVKILFNNTWNSFGLWDDTTRWIDRIHDIIDEINDNWIDSMTWNDNLTWEES